MNSLENLLPIDISGNFNFNDYLNRGANGDHVLWVPIAIFLCILAIWVICKFVRKLHKNYWYDSDNLLQGGMMIGNAVLVVVTNLLIMVYVLSTGPAALWFMYPGEDGNWTRTVIFGIVYLYCIINLLVGFLKTMDDFCGEIDGRINCKWGLGTLAIGLIFKSSYLLKDNNALLAINEISHAESDLPDFRTLYYSAIKDNKDAYDAFKIIKTFAEHGETKAQFYLGNLYSDYIQDYQQAIKWYQEAAEKDENEAKYNLGLIYEKFKDNQCAFMWFSQAVNEYRRLAEVQRRLCKNRLHRLQP